MSSAGKLTGTDTPNALQVVNDFAANFTRLTPGRLRQRAACFGGHHIVAPALLPPPPTQHADAAPLREAAALLEEAAAFGGFNSKRSPPAAAVAWEGCMRTYLLRTDVAAALDRLQPLVRDTAAPIVHKLAALLQRPAGIDVPADVAPVPAALAACEYVAVMDLSVARMHNAWESVRAGAPAAAAAAARPRSEMHVTLWHRAEAGTTASAGGSAAVEGEGLAEQRGQAALAAAGSSVLVRVLGFDCSDSVVAARVQLVDVAAGLQDVPRPHVTVWHAAGVPAKAAGWLQERVARGEAGVAFLPLAEEMHVHGVVRAVAL